MIIDRGRWTIDRGLLSIVLATSRTGDSSGARTCLEGEEFRECRDADLIWVKFCIDADDGKFKEAVARLDGNLDKIPHLLDRITLIESHPLFHDIAQSKEYRDWKFPPGQK